LTGNQNARPAEITASSQRKGAVAIAPIPQAADAPAYSVEPVDFAAGLNIGDAQAENVLFGREEFVAIYSRTHVLLIL
jgi:hypothetical protein